MECEFRKKIQQRIYLKLIRESFIQIFKLADVDRYRPKINIFNMDVLVS
ncbi:hypothetical protein L291_3165 [Acinetobacter guillouiae MSP4-18]|nr:hypothetical protein F981_03968 [Acinetobacter guillouiae CIP 63.46]EPH32506.1 hypothetical protein L291_3165 [Acinetobacter guillouiae MSP4-18]